MFKKRINLLVIIFAVALVFTGSLILLFPKKTTAVVSIDAEKISDIDNIETYRLYAIVSDSSKFNFVKIKLTPTNLDSISVKGLNGFEVVESKSEKEENIYGLGSNRIYTSVDTQDGNKLYFAEITAHRIASPCKLSISLVNDGTKINTNNFTIVKDAYKNNELATTVYVGEEFNYKITVTGDNDIKSDNVVVTDEIPSELEIINPGTGTKVGQKITWNLGSFEAGKVTKTLTVLVRAKEEIKGKNIINTAVLKVADKELDDDAEVKGVYSDISITKKANKKSVSNGEEFYFDIVVQNNGTGLSKNVVVEDTLDTNLTFIEASKEYINEGNKYTFNLGKIEAGESVTIRIKVRVKDNNKLDSILNRAIATEEGDTPKEDTDTVEILKPNLSVTKVANIKKVKRGNNLTYTIKVTNNGKGAAKNVVVTDTINSNFEIVSVDPNSYSNNNINVTYDTILPNETKTITVVVKAKKDAVLGNVLNTVTVTSSNNSSVTDNETVEIVDSNVTIEKTASKTNLRVGEEFIYTIKVTNNGSADSNQLTITDVIDSNLEIIDKNGASQNGQTITWIIESLASGKSQSFNVKVKVKNISSIKATIPNIASVEEVGKGKSQDEVNVNVEKPVLEIEKNVYEYDKTASSNNKKLTVRPGESFVYRITVKNIGSISSGKFTVKDTLNNLLEIVDSDGASVNGKELTWQVDNLDINSSKTFNVVVKLSKNAKASTKIPNTAVLSYGEEEKRDTADVTVIEEDIYIVKTASVSEVAPLDEFNYTLTIGNKGDSYSGLITVTDNLPSYLSYVGEEYPEKVTTKHNGQKLVYQINGLEKNEEIKITISVKVNEDVKGINSIINKAILSYEDKTKESSNEIEVLKPNIKIKKESSVDTIVVGEEYFYTITVTNVGNADAKNLTIIDTFDKRLSIIDSDNGKIEGNKITWNIDTLKKNESKKYTIKVVLKEIDKDDNINNVVVVKSPDGIDKKDEVQNKVVVPKISITKKSNKEKVKKDEEFEYYITITNESNIDLNGVLITDTFDDSLKILDAKGFIIDGQTINKSVNFKAKESQTFTIKVKVNDNKKDEIINVALTKYKDINKKSNEVVVRVVINNPKTGDLIDPDGGFSLPLLTVLVGTIGIAIFYIKTKGKSKVFKI